MKKLKTYGIRNYQMIILLTLFLGSCAPAYVPNMINTPLFSNEKEFTANIGGGTSGFDAQIAVAATNHFAIMFNTSFSNQSSQSSDDYYGENNTTYHKHTFFEGGIGYFDSPNSWLNFEVFGGYGSGSVSSYDNFWSDSISGKYNRVFLQPSMGFVSDYLDVSFTPRFAFVGFNGDLNLENRSVSGTGFFLEPTISIKFGFKQFKFFGQMGYSFKVNSSDYDFDYQPFILTIGTQLTLGRHRETSITD